MCVVRLQHIHVAVLCCYVAMCTELGQGVDENSSQDKIKEEINQRQHSNSNNGDFTYQSC